MRDGHAIPVPAWAVAVAVLAGSGLAAFCFYPGYLSGDANWQYEQAVAGRYVDWHPVMMTWLWRQLDRVVTGPGGMFLFHAGLVWLGLALCVRAFCRGWPSFALPLALLGLFPPVFAMQSQIGKDTGMGAALLVGFGLWAHAQRCGPRAALAALCGAALACFYAMGVRHNGASAVLPLALAMGFSLARIGPEGWRNRLTGSGRRVALGLALFAALYGGARFASEQILGPQGGRYKLYQLIPIYDLAGISLRSAHLHIPESHDQGDPWTLRQLFEIYNPHSNLWMHWKDPGPGPRLMPLFDRDDVLRELFAAWAEAIAEHPLAYLQHRRDLFLAHLGIPEGTPRHTVRFGVSPDFHYVEPTRFDSATNAVVTGYLERESDSVLFRPWPYLVATTLCMLAAWRIRSRHRVPIWILGSMSILMTAPFALIGVAADFRYLWGTVPAALVQIVMLFDGLGPPEREAGKAA